MRIGGFQKQSLVDWEGKVVAVIFTKGCNFRCGFCHNPSLVYPELMRKTEDIPEQTVLGFLMARKSWLDGVVITGGEPTVQPDLMNFIQKIKNHGFPLKLDTNGSNPEKLRRLIEAGLVDYVAMDIKTVLETEKYCEICGTGDRQLTAKIEESLTILKESRIEYQLRTTVVPQYHNSEIIGLLQMKFSEYNYRLQAFRELK